MRDQIATTLLAAFYETHTAVDGADGVDKALRNPPDLIICDMMMPNMNGQEVLVEVRQHPELASVPFIFLTAVDSINTMRESMNLGADDYLFKPFLPNELLNAVNTRLKYHRQIEATAEQQLEAIKLRLARTITHELRTPLSLIVTSLEAMSMPDMELSKEEAAEMLDTMNRGTKRLGHCIEQMVFATYLTTGVYTADSVARNAIASSVKELVDKAINSAKQFTIRQAEKVDIRLTADSDENVVIQCDPGAMKHALAELVSNALIFSPPGGNVRISYKRLQDDVRIMITDNGQGIPDQDLKEALDWFGQVNREMQEQQGMGLGLPLANQLIAMHNGSLEIRSIVGKGTRAIVTLPAAEAVA
jgi:two-component system, sensor histidine kinase and response regulator